MLSSGTTLNQTFKYRANFDLFPYKIQSQSELTPEQKARRFEFAQRLLGKQETDERFIEKFYMLVECVSYLSGLVN